MSTEVARHKLHDQALRCLKRVSVNPDVYLRFVWSGRVVVMLWAFCVLCVACLWCDWCVVACRVHGGCHLGDLVCESNVLHGDTARCGRCCRSCRGSNIRLVSTNTKRVLKGAKLSGNGGCFATKIYKNRCDRTDFQQRCFHPSMLTSPF